MTSEHEVFLQWEGASLKGRRKFALFTALADSAPANLITDDDRADWTLDKMRRRFGLLDGIDQISADRAVWCSTWAAVVIRNADQHDTATALQAAAIILRHSSDTFLRAAATELQATLRGELT